MMGDSVNSEGSRGAVCSICQGPLENGELLQECDECRARFHSGCWEHNEGCGTYGCRRAPAQLKVTILEGSHPDAWGDAKACPSCGAVIGSSALRCKSCRAVFNTRAPLSPEEYRLQEDRKAAARRAAWLSVALFSVSALGILAPATLILSGSWVAARRRSFRSSAGPAEILIYASCVLSAAYSCLLAVIFLGGW
jgi:hypothetical protein